MAFTCHILGQSVTSLELTGKSLRKRTESGAFRECRACPAATSNWFHAGESSMALAKILLPVNSESQSAYLIETAFCLARRFGASIEALHPKGLPLDDVALYRRRADVHHDRGIVAHRRTARPGGRKSRAATCFPAAAARHQDIKTQFVGADGPIDAITGRRARLSDLIVTGTTEGLRLALLGEGARGRNVSQWPSGSDCSRHGSRSEYRRNPDHRLEGQHRGCPGASRITEFHFPRQDRASRHHQRRPRRGNARSPKRRRIWNCMARRSRPPSSTGAPTRCRKCLRAETQSRRGALLVMGAFSHWRWQEWLFGGITEQILHDGTVPVLMVH